MGNRLYEQDNCQIADRYDQPRPTITDLPNTNAESSRDVTRSLHFATHLLDRGLPALAANSGSKGLIGRKRPYEALRDFSIPTAEASFAVVQPTRTVNESPDRLYHLDNRGKMTSRLFSPVSKLNYAKRPRLLRTPSPAPSSEGEMDPDSPLLLKPKRIQASREGPPKQNIPKIVSQTDHGAWYHALQQPPHPMMISRYSFKTPSPTPRLQRHCQDRHHGEGADHEAHEADEDEDGIVHFDTPRKWCNVPGTDKDGMLYLQPLDSAGEGAEARNDDAEANDDTAEAAKGESEAAEDESEVDEDARLQWWLRFRICYDENGDGSMKHRGLSASRSRMRWGRTCFGEVHMTCT